MTDAGFTVFTYTATNELASCFLVLEFCVFISMAERLDSVDFMDIGTFGCPWDLCSTEWV